MHRSELEALTGDSTFVQVRSTLRKHLRSGIGAHSDTAIAWVDDLKRRNKALGQTWTFMGFDLKPRAAMEDLRRDRPVRRNRLQPAPIRNYRLTAAICRRANRLRQATTGCRPAEPV